MVVAVLNECPTGATETLVQSLDSLGQACGRAVPVGGKAGLLLHLGVVPSRRSSSPPAMGECKGGCQGGGSAAEEMRDA